MPTIPLFYRRPPPGYKKVWMECTITEQWKLCLNVDKSKIVVFRKGGQLGRDDHWFYGDSYIDVLNSFNYLGVTLSYIYWQFCCHPTDIGITSHKGCIQSSKSNVQSL